MVSIRNIEGNSDASIMGTTVPYMRETYPQMRARLAKELAERASETIKPETASSATQPQMDVDETDGGRHEATV